jgi:hypothetical protein
MGLDRRTFGGPIERDHQPDLPILEDDASAFIKTSARHGCRRGRCAFSRLIVLGSDPAAALPPSRQARAATWALEYLR